MDPIQKLIRLDFKFVELKSLQLFKTATLQEMLQPLKRKVLARSLLVWFFIL